MAAGSKVGSAWYELNANDSKLKSALNNADRTIQTTGTNAEKTFAGRMSRAAAAFGEAVRRAAVVGVAALAAGLVVAVTRAAAFEKAMLNVNSIAKLNTADFEKMKEQVLDLSLELPQSATTLAEGLYQIQSSGFAGADGMVVLESAAKAASAGLTTTDVSAKGLTSILNAYGLEAEDAAGISDLMFKIVDRGVLTFEELSSEIGTTAAIAAALDVPFTEVGAALAVMTRNGFSAAEANTSLGAIMTSILKPSAEAATLANELGLEWDASAVKADGLVSVLNDMIVATGGDQEKMAILLGDVRSIRGAFSLAGEGGAELNDELAIMEDHGGALDTALSYQKKGLSYNLELLRNNLDFAAISIGTALIPAIVPLVTKMAEWLRNNQDLVDSIAKGLVGVIEDLIGIIGDVIGVIATMAGHIGDWVAANQPLIDQMRELAGGAFKVISEGIIAIGEAIAGAMNDETQRSLILTGLAVGALTVALGLLVAHPVIAALGLIVVAVGLLKVAWEEDWGGIRSAIVDNWPAIHKALDDIYGGLQIFSRVVHGIFLGIIMMWTEVVGSIQRGAEVVVGAMAAIPGPWQADMQKAADALKELADGTQTEADRIEAEIGVMANAPLDHLPTWTLGVTGYTTSLNTEIPKSGAAAAKLRGAVTTMMDTGTEPATLGTRAATTYTGGVAGQTTAAGTAGGKVSGAATGAMAPGTAPGFHGLTTALRYAGAMGTWPVRLILGAAGASIVANTLRPLTYGAAAAFYWGSQLALGFARGIYSSAWAVINAARYVANSAAAYLQIRSPAKMGPLKIPMERSGLKLGQGLARGLLASAADVRSAAGVVAGSAMLPFGSLGSLSVGGSGAIAGAVGGLGGGQTVTVNFGDINITGFGGSQAEIESVSQRLADSIRLRARSAF